MGMDGRCSPHSQVWRGVDMLVKKKYKKHVSCFVGNKIKLMVE